jgi:hypothetical protein
MTKDETLRLALEWLESHKPKISEGSLPVLTHAQVRDAVKAALEKKAENAEELGLNYYVFCCTDKTCSKCKAALEAKDEPVAWGFFFEDGEASNELFDTREQGEKWLLSDDCLWAGSLKPLYTMEKL